nr:hypothetical protein [Tanacetum cinerariifolium]
MILESVENGPLIWPIVEENRVTRTKKYAKLSRAEKIQADCDMKVTNIILQGLPANIYSLMNHHRVAKDLWERVQKLIQGTTLTKQERECKLYDAFDKFTHIKGESLHKYYLRFTQPINDMNIYNMKMEKFQVNTKFLNSLPPEWSKIVNDVKLVKDLHTTNFDQLHAYLEQQKLYANEVCFLRELEAQEARQILDEEQLTFLTYPRVPDGQAVQTIILNNVAFQTKDLDTYDSDCDDISNTKVVLMANISNYGSNVILESSVDKQRLEIAKIELLLEIDRLLQQIISQDILLTMTNLMSLIGESVNMERKQNKSCDKSFNLEAELLKSQNAHNDLLKRYPLLEKHCISIESLIQLNQEIFQKDQFYDNQNALELLEYFQNKDLKAHQQEKDPTTCKLKEIIKTMSEKSKEDNVNYDYCEIETKNVELKNSVVKLLSKNERLCTEINHVKWVFKEQLDSIKKTRVRTKEQSDSLMDKLNLKSAKNKDVKLKFKIRFL